MITSSILLAIEIQHHGISSSTPPLALLVSCTHCTLRELLPPPFGRVASLQLSLVLGRVASLPSYSSLLPCVGHLPRASSLVNGSVAVSGNRRSSGPCGPATWYCTISWHHHSVRSARRKVVTSFRSSFPRTSRVVTLVSRVSFPSLGYSYLHSPWRQPRAHHPSCPPPRGGTSFGCVVVLHCLGDPDWTWPGVMREGLSLVVPWFRRLFPPPCLYCTLVSVTGFKYFSFCLLGTRLRFSFCFLPICLIYFFTCASVSL